jgi:hypothetical protein
MILRGWDRDRVSPKGTQGYGEARRQGRLHHGCGTRFEVLRNIGVGFVDICLGMGTPQQQTHAVELLGREVLPVVHSWDNAFPEN